MLRLIWILIILFVSVWLGLQIAKDPGLAFFSYRQWSVEMPLWFAALLFILLLLAGYSLLRFFGGLDRMFYQLKNWLRFRKVHNAYSKTNRGLIELIEHQWQDAEYYLKAGITQSEVPLINYLGLALAADAEGAFDRRDQYLRKAHFSAPRAEIVIGITEAQLKIKHGQTEAAYVVLMHLHQIAPKHTFVLSLLERLYVQLNDWQALIQLLPKLYKNRVIPRENFAIFEKNIYIELLKKATRTHETGAAVEILWESIPRKLRKDPALIYEYAKALSIDPDKADTLQLLLNKILNKVWNEKLVNLYGSLLTTYPQKQLISVERWLKQYPNQPALLHIAGLLAKRNQLWGKARSYFEESLKLQLSEEVYLDYGKLLEQLGDREMALESYRDGLLLKLRHS